MRHHFTASLPRRSAECTITESLDAVYLHISCSNSEGLQEDVDYMMWLLSILTRYEEDDRLVIVTSSNSDLVGVIDSHGGKHASQMID